MRAASRADRRTTWHGAFRGAASFRDTGRIEIRPNLRRILGWPANSNRSLRADLERPAHDRRERIAHVFAATNGAHANAYRTTSVFFRDDAEREAPALRRLH